MIIRKPLGHLTNLPISSEALSCFDARLGASTTSLFVATMQRGLAGFVPRLDGELREAYDQSLSLVHADGRKGTWVQRVTIDASVCEIIDACVEPDTAQRHGIAKSMLRNALAWFDHMGTERLDAVAASTVGGYFWARAGFVPDAPSWDGIVLKCRHFAQLQADPRIGLLAERLLSQGPSHIHLIAKWRFGGRHIGKDILLGSAWRGSLDLTDAHRYSLVESYTR